MASDEYIWDLVLQEAAAGGVLDLEYLNDDRQLYSSSYGKATPTVPSIDHLFNDCLLDDLFSFDDVTPSYKPVGTETIVATGILPEAVGVEAGVFYTDSFILDNVSQDTSSATDMVDYSLPVPDQFTSYTLKPELVPASSPDHLQYVADYSQSFAPATTPVEESAVSHFENPATFSFPDFTPDMLSRLLASLSQVECDEEETTSSFCDESVYMLTEDSANCSEMDEDGAETDSESFNSEELASSRGGRSQGQASSKAVAGSRGADRKKRKMQQNRVAAYRYRQKKKAEQDASFAEREGLEKRNAALKSKVQQMTQEIAYLRGLMADMVKVRSAVRQ